MLLLLQLLRKRKILTSTEIRASEFRSMAFSPDSKYLATLGSAPDWTLIYWHWEKSKALAMTHTGHPVSTGPVEQVSRLFTFLLSLELFPLSPHQFPQFCATYM